MYLCNNENLFSNIWDLCTNNVDLCTINDDLSTPYINNDDHKY